MTGFIITIFIGIICIGIGISNRKGNISSLHSYHRHRVSKEEQLPFGKMVGSGTIILGISLIVFGGLSIVGTILLKDIYLLIGIGIMIAGIIIGLALSFYAMIKYNKGIF